MQELGTDFSVLGKEISVKAEFIFYPRQAFLSCPIILTHLHNEKENSCTYWIRHKC